MKLVFATITLIYSSFCYASNLSQFLGTGSSGVTWAGYTSSTTNGAAGNIKGLHDKCHADYPGSHACSFEEIMFLGASYPYSQKAWVYNGYRGNALYDGSYRAYIAFTKDGAASVYNSFTGVSSLADYNKRVTCIGWSYGGTSSSYKAPAMGTSGAMEFNSCSTLNSVPCCK